MRRLIWGFTLLVAAWPAAAAPDDKSDDKPSPAEQVKTLMADYQNGQQEYYAAVGKAKTAAEQTKALEKRPDPDALAAKLLELSEQNPDDEGVTPVALVNVMTLPLRGGEGTKLRQQALEKLTNEHSASDQLEPILLRFTYEPSPAAAAFLRAVAEKNPKDALKGKATYGLGAMLQRASGYARQMHQKPDLEERIEVAFGKETAQWLRDVDADGLGKEAEELFEKVSDKFADVPLYGEETLGEAAQGQLFEIRNLAIGKTAPEIEGEDLDGDAFKLSDYRGKVVVIDFWGNW